MFVYLGQRDLYFITTDIKRIYFKASHGKYPFTRLAKLIYVELTNEQHQELNKFSAITLSSLEEIIIM